MSFRAADGLNTSWIRLMSACRDEDDHDNDDTCVCVCVCATGLTAAAMAELQKLQKMKMMMSLQNGNESDNDDLHSNTGIPEKHQQTHSAFRTVCTRISIQVIIVEHHADGSGENKEPEKKMALYILPSRSPKLLNENKICSPWNVWNNAGNRNLKRGSKRQKTVTSMETWPADTYITHTAFEASVTYVPICLHSA